MPYQIARQVPLCFHCLIGTDVENYPIYLNSLSLLYSFNLGLIIGCVKRKWMWLVFGPIKKKNKQYDKKYILMMYFVLLVCI